MTLWNEIVEVYPELTNADFDTGGVIELRNDADEAGDYISKWNYGKPLPEGMKVGKN